MQFQNQTSFVYNNDINTGYPVDNRFQPINYGYSVYPNYYWTTGTIMTPLHSPPSTPPPQILPKEMQIQEGEWTSLYIPMIPTDMHLSGLKFSKDNIQDFIENKIKIGRVRRIDFVDRDDMPSFDEKTNPIQAAFIHMQVWYDNYNAHMLRNTINQKGEIRQRGYHDGKQMIRFTAKEGTVENMFRYFVFKINHKPIPDADGKLNIHQLAALKTKYEAELEEARAEITRLKEELSIFIPEKI
jgi:hypothetical protein